MYIKIIIDTCGWIDFLRNSKGHLGDQVENAIVADDAVICMVSIAELLQGVKNAKQQKQLDLLFEHIEVLEITKENWFEAGKLTQQLRRKGVTTSLTDSLIASVAIAHNMPVLTIDTDFQHFPISLIV